MALHILRIAGAKQRANFKLFYLTGNGELLELRLLETGFLSRFQLNP
jgi:hypothetical protein